MDTKQIPQMPATATVLGALALGCLFDFFFYRRPLGVSVPLFTWTAVASAAYVASRHGRRPSSGQVWVGGGALLFSVFVAWRAAPELTAANLAVTAYLFALYLAPWLRARSLSDFDESDCAAAPKDVLSESMLRGADELEKVLAGVRSDAVPWRAAATGALVALPILAFFLCLMLSADTVFKSLFGRFFSFLDPFPLIAQGAVTASVAGLALGAGVWLRRRPDAGGTPSEWGRLARLGTGQAWGFVESAVAAGLVNALFAAFSAVQVMFLVGGKERIEALGTGITYSDYARQGFWEMMLIGALSVALCLAVDECVASDTPRRKSVKQANIVFASLTTGVMMLSAAYRLWLYEEAYGFTALRFYSHTFTAYVGVIFVLMCVKTLAERSRGAFLRDAAVASLGTLAIWNAVNPHALIASANIKAAMEGRRGLDAKYLSQLSEDAACEIMAASPLIPEQERSKYIESIFGRLGMAHERLERGGWPAYHRAYARAGSLMIDLP